MSPRRFTSIATTVSLAVAAHEVDRTDGGRILAPHQRQADLDGVRAGRQQHLEVRLDTVLLQARGRRRARAEMSLSTSWSVIVSVSFFGFVTTQWSPSIDERVRRVHPVQRLVRAAVGMDRHAAVGLHHDQPGRLGKVGVEPTGVVDRTAGDHQTHGATLSGSFGARSPSTCSRIRFWISSRRCLELAVGDAVDVRGRARSPP